MNILEYEKLFQAEDTLDMVLEELLPTFDKIDHYRERMKSNDIDNPASMRASIEILSGLYAEVRSVLAIAHAEITNREAKEYCRIKFDVENEGGKFTTQIDSATKKEATSKTSNHRRVYSMLFGYCEACKQMVNALQSDVKDQKQSNKIIQCCEKIRYEYS